MCSRVVTYLQALLLEHGMLLILRVTLPQQTISVHYKLTRGSSKCTYILNDGHGHHTTTLLCQGYLLRLFAWAGFGLLSIVSTT